MKKLLTLFIILCCSVAAYAQGVAVNMTGATADSTAIFDASSNTKGVLVSRMDSTHRAGINHPATGLLIYQTDGVTPGFYNYTGSVWQKVGAIVQPHVQVYTLGSYSFITSANITANTVFKITLIAGGGGGGGGFGPGGAGGGGGGGGASATCWASGLASGSSYTVVAGGGGSGGFPPFS